MNPTNVIWLLKTHPQVALAKSFPLLVLQRLNSFNGNKAIVPKRNWIPNMHSLCRSSLTSAWVIFSLKTFSSGQITETKGLMWYIVQKWLDQGKQWEIIKKKEKE